ncbi:MAG: hypothetical protein L6Q81_17000 [Bacteroidia bacterium]|nr:hypothetical protein [Bacteroidia bacterium]
MKISPLLFKHVIVSLICIAVVSCTGSSDEALKQPVNDSNIDLGELPKISVRAIAEDSIYKHGDDPAFIITIVNTSDSVQRLLFDRPKLSSGGPWHTTADVKSLDVGSAELKYMQNVVMNSQSYSKEELDSLAYVVAPGDSIACRYRLGDIVSLNTPDQRLPKGRFGIQLYYAGTRAKEVVVVRIE